MARDSPQDFEIGDISSFRSARFSDTRTVTGGDPDEALLGDFGYIVRAGLRESVGFSDFGQGTVPEMNTDPVRARDLPARARPPVRPSTRYSRQGNPRRQQRTTPRPGFLLTSVNSVSSTADSTGRARRGVRVRFSLWLDRDWRP